MLILGLKWLRRRGNGGIRSSPVLNFKSHGLCRYFTKFWAFHLKLKFLQAFKPLWRSFMDVFGNGAWGAGGEEANIRPFPIVLGNFWATFWRLEQLFAVLATSSKRAFLSNFWAKFRFRAHIKHEKVKNCIENFSSCECLECLSIFFLFFFFF